MCCELGLLAAKRCRQMCIWRSTGTSTTTERDRRCCQGNVVWQCSLKCQEEEMSRRVELAREERANSRLESILDPPETDWVWPQVELGRECRSTYFTQERVGKRFWIEPRWRLMNKCQVHRSGRSGDRGSTGRMGRGDQWREEAGVIALTSGLWDCGTEGCC